MNILVVRIGRAGDMVMTTPAVQALLDRYPGARFDLLTSPDGRRIFAGFDHRIDDIIVWDRAGVVGWLRGLTVRGALRDKEYEHVYCFDTSTRIARICNGVGAKLHWRSDPEQPVHAADFCLELVGRSRGQPSRQYVSYLPVSDESMAHVRSELRAEEIDDDDYIVALHPTFSGFGAHRLLRRSARRHKLWPVERFGDLARRIAHFRLTNGRHPRVIMDLLENEVAHGRRIAAHSDGTVTLLSGPLDFQRYKALLARVDLVVSPDTGPMHIGAAVGTRVVALFSGTHPSRCGPYAHPDRVTVVRAEDVDPTVRGIEAIDADTVSKACVMQLQRAVRERTN